MATGPVGTTLSAADLNPDLNDPNMMNPGASTRRCSRATFQALLIPGSFYLPALVAWSSTGASLTKSQASIAPSAFTSPSIRGTRSRVCGWMAQFVDGTDSRPAATFMYADTRWPVLDNDERRAFWPLGVAMPGERIPNHNGGGGGGSPQPEALMRQTAQIVRKNLPQVDALNQATRKSNWPDAGRELNSRRIKIEEFQAENQENAGLQTALVSDTDTFLLVQKDALAKVLFDAIQGPASIVVLLLCGQCRGLPTVFRLQIRGWLTTRTFRW
ncbi:hypothetical protein diail_11196 [Diaporthe ilicicola]|nr:hypothetical protein diail_11196 [Diaporthe ilicicola]